MLKRPRIAGPRQYLIDGLIPALAVGVIGAIAFYLVHLPLPFVLGPMYACLLVNLAYPRLTSPSWTRPPVVALIGVMLGTTFKPELLERLDIWATPLAGLLVVVATIVTVNYLYYHSVAKFDKATAFYSSSPGGLTEMVILGGSGGGKETDIALAHSSRILLVVMLLPWVIRYALDIPFSGRTISGPSIAQMDIATLWLILACAVAGTYLGKALKFPAYAFVGPMIVSALFHLSGMSDFSVPSEFVIFAQVVLGVSVGVGFVGVPPRLVGQALLFGLGSSLMMVLIALFGAYVVSRISPFDVSALLLAFAPGGFPEMSLIAYAMGVDVALVAALHVVRIAIVLLFVPMVYRVFVAD
ncbi:AbrB family transcriptional regulator [Allomesorhizobium camelthorni]|uniref:AbrB family transcriptional regulator n=1 Tax=Allomesorhizobium camelthorni TaxID=475069 RepID=A0A6G4WG47_9HYPH|nr:AbrB family transcriptional regulator [Mesorhizobium camelthorni]NGO53731.1 AbrB family transcriptional regulator [Mesorhizobium camelthorni]